MNKDLGNVDNDTGNANSPKIRKSRRFQNLSEGSSSFKGLTAVGSFGKMGGRGSGRIAAEDVWFDKL